MQRQFDLRAVEILQTVYMLSKTTVTCITKMAWFVELFTCTVCASYSTEHKKCHKLRDKNVSSDILHNVSSKKTQLRTAISRMMTLLPFVYRKFLPFGSPPITIDAPLVVLGRVANVPSTVSYKTFFTNLKKILTYS